MCFKTSAERRSIKLEKQKLREQIWREMEERGIARFPLPCRGRIPNFRGAEAAASKLLSIPEFKSAKIVLVAPDSPQKPVRKLVLREGKTLVMPTPRLKSGFLVIKPGTAKINEAITIRGAFKHGVLTGKLPRVDFVVQGCVAVDREGRRLGKGGGYGDREIEMARKENPNVKVAVTCHSIQVVSRVPFEKGDQRVDYICTEKEIIVVEASEELEKQL